ncbi:MAG: hypothetical protein N4A33_00170 [Bacteriovoracaceae bacterium]|jgi:outer membrane protein W/uncharacterized protein YdbL (DUF1318 family)|nr:hypothetical protein [Bacteriovoracaceae bacterium]
MKTCNKFTKSILSLAVVATTFASAYANEAILNSDPIDVTGYVKEVPATDHELETVKNELRKQKQAIQVNKEKAKSYEKLGRSTEKLADVTEDMIEERKESQATIDKYNKKIECLMAQDPGADCDEYVKTDKVSTAAAAPTVVAPVESSTIGAFEAIKVLPYVGMSSFQSENEQLEANIAAGVRAESDITSRISVGVGFKYTSMQTLDSANYFGNNFGVGYWNTFGNQGREIDYTNLNFDINGKFFITKANRLRPYVGAALAYNRTTMKYNDNQNWNGNIYGNFGDEQLTTGNISASLLLGSEVVFTKSIGMNLEFGYSKGLGSSFNTQRNAAQSPDMIRLQNLNEELADAHQFSVNAGMIIYF